MHQCHRTSTARRLLVVVCLLAMALSSGATSALAASSQSKGASAPGLRSARSTLIAPSNDNFAQPVQLGSRFIDEVDFTNNIGATGEAGEPSHFGTDKPDRSVWYLWTAPVTGSAIFRTQGSDFDTVLAAYTGNSLTGLTRRAENDDLFFPDGTFSRQSQIRFGVTKGSVYRIAVDGFTGVNPDGAQGNIVLSLSANDDFEAAQPLPDPVGALKVLTDGNNTGSTGQPGEPNHAGSSPDRSVWYRWTPPASGTAQFDTVLSDFDTTLAVYTGNSIASLTEVAFNNDLDSTHVQSLVTLPVTAGTVYNIAVDGFTAAEGPFILRHSLAKAQQPTVSIGDRSIAEGNAGTKTVSVPVTLSAAATGQVTVKFATANGTALAPGDYTAKTGTVTFAAGQTIKNIAVTVKGDTKKEPNETFKVNLSQPTGATIADGSATVTITNND